MLIVYPGYIEGLSSTSSFLNMASHMSLAQMEHDGAMTAGICVNSSDNFVSEGRCHLSVKGITQYDATFKSFPPETEPLSLSYAEKIQPHH